MSTTMKATTVTISDSIFGDDLEVLMLPCGKYAIALPQVSALFQFSNMHASRDIKALLGNNFSFAKVKSDLNSKAVNIVDLETLSKIAIELCIKGNPVAISFLRASFIEVIERRADSAFGLLRTEQERNQRFITRRDGILSRHFWTDTVDYWMKNHPEQVSDNYRRFVYSNVSDCLNRTLFGKTARQLLEYYDLPKDASPRDYFPSETLRLVDSIEKAVGVRVRKTGAEPKQALKEMLAFMGIEPDESLL